MYLTTLHNRSIIRLSGPDAAPFLQGLISQDIHLCHAGQAIYAALLTPQGKFLHDLFIYAAQDGYLIDGETGRADDLVTRLNRYRLRSNIRIDEVAGEYSIHALFNDDMEAPLEEPPHTLYPIMSADPRHPALGFRVVMEKTLPVPSDTTPVAFDAYDQHRLKLGVTDGSRDMLIDKSTLIEGNYDLLNGISWSKGCYVGQEVTARMHYRHLTKKRLFPLRIEGEAPAPGIILRYEDEEVGEMRSHNGPYGLALFNIEKAKHILQNGIGIKTNTATLTIHQPEWLKI